MPQRVNAEQLIQAIQELGIDPAAAFKLIEIVYMTPQEEVAKAKQMLQSGGGQQSQGQPQGQGQPEQEGGEEKILQQVATLLSKGTPPEQVEQMLQEQGASPEQAREIVQTIVTQMQGGEQSSEPRV